MTLSPISTSMSSARPARRDGRAAPSGGTSGCARSSRRPISRKRQPAKRYMFSCTRPEKPASLRSSTVMARVASSPAVTRPRKRWAVLDRSISASQPSGEKRSRIRPALRGRRIDAGDAARRAWPARRRRRCSSRQARDHRQERRSRLGRFGEAGMIGAQDPHGAFGALDVAAEPDEIVGGAAGQDRRRACASAASPSRAGSSVTGSTGAAPSTQTSAAWPPWLHGDRRGVGRGADAGEAAGHDRPAGLACAWRRRAASPAAAPAGRRRRQGMVERLHRFLADDSRRRQREQPLGQRRALGGARARRRAPCRRCRRTAGRWRAPGRSSCGRDCRARAARSALLPAPPGGDVRQLRGPRRQRWRQMPGRKASSARVSRMPEPMRVDHRWCRPGARPRPGPGVPMRQS